MKVKKKKSDGEYEKQCRHQARQLHVDNGDKDDPGGGGGEEHYEEENETSNTLCASQCNAADERTVCPWHDTVWLASSLNGTRIAGNS